MEAARVGDETGVRNYRDLVVWQRAMEFVGEVYRAARQLPRDERFALTSQLRRSAVSVPSNIAEGHTRQGREFGKFISIARGSLAEAETQLLIAVQVGYLEESAIVRCLALAEEIKRMTAVLARKIVEHQA